MSDLVTCPKCAKLYTSNSKSCPHCDHKNVETIAKVITGLLIIGVMFWAISDILSPDPDAAKKAQAAAAEKVAIAKMPMSECIKHYAQSSFYSSKDGGKSQVGIMAACQANIERELPQCFQDDPPGLASQADSPAFQCRIGVLTAIRDRLRLEGY